MTPVQPEGGDKRWASRAIDVTKRFGDFVALDNVSVDVPDGSLTALLGPSGSGKSTLLRVIAGLEQPDAGQRADRGEDVDERPARSAAASASSSSTTRVQAHDRLRTTSPSA